METYLVGGAVRDELLGLDGHEKDYVVVGSTSEAMLAEGYRPVGKDFPVFLHPETNEEYALARTERKVGPGHQGFECNASPEVTLEEDLLRRDLTINAIAKSEHDELIDPHGGIQDLDRRLLRHVSDAFAEDPLRILRLARFKAKFHHLGFNIDKGTLDLVSQMVADDQLSELTPERILLELDKALMTDNPAEFFVLLQDINAHELLWPEVSAESIERLSKRSDISDPESRFALLLADASPDAIESLCKRIRCPRMRTDVTVLVAKHGDTWRSLDDLDAEAIVDFLHQLDALRKDERFQLFNRICADIYNTQDLRWLELKDIAAAVKATDVDANAKGRELGAAIRAEQVARVRASNDR